MLPEHQLPACQTDFHTFKLKGLVINHLTPLSALLLVNGTFIIFFGRFFIAVD
jgi:hypothetical protein